MKTMILSLLISIPLLTLSQSQNNLKLDATVKGFNDNALTNTTISLNKPDGTLILKTTTNSAGHFEVIVDFDMKVEMLIEAEGHQSKIIEIDTRNVPVASQKWGFEFGGFIIDLEKENIGQKPDTVARLFYDTDLENFDYSRF